VTVRGDHGRATRLIVWRHGNTDWNRDSRVQGQTDIPLNDTGLAQARAAAAMLAGLLPDALVSSDLRRAAQTAAALAELTGLPVRPDERLRERYYGRWQGRTMGEIAKLFPAEHARWRAGDPSPGSEIESNEDLGKRVAEALHAAAEIVPGGTVVVAAHGGAVKQGLISLLGWPAELTPTVAVLDNCHWIEVRRDSRVNPGGWRLWSYNVGATTELEPPLPA